MAITWRRCQTVSQTGKSLPVDKTFAQHRLFSFWKGKLFSSQKVIDFTLHCRLKYFSIMVGLHCLSRSSESVSCYNLPKQNCYYHFQLSFNFERATYIACLETRCFDICFDVTQIFIRIEEQLSQEDHQRIKKLWKSNVMVKITNIKKDPEHVWTPWRNCFLRHKLKKYKQGWLISNRQIIFIWFSPGYLLLFFKGLFVLIDGLLDNGMFFIDAK